jgi:hypothetical protein
MRRFAVVKHDGKGVIPVHHLLADYHWTTLDTEHVLLLGQVHPTSVHDLDHHPAVLLMPSLFSSKCIFQHADERGKSDFCIPLRECLSLQPQHQAMHLAEIAHDLHGRIFALDV